MKKFSINPTYLSIVILIIVSILSTQLAIVDGWKGTHWLMSYEFDFIKRGMIGSVTQYIFPIPISLEQISLLSYSIYFILSISLIAYILPAFKNDIFFITLLLASGFSLQQLGYDIGRHDQVVLLITLLSLKLITTYKRKLFTLTAFLITLSALSMVIHEASALISVPLVFSALTISAFKLKQGYAPAFFYLTSSIIIFIIIIILGAPSVSAESWVSFLQQRSAFEVNLNAAAVTHNSLKDNITISMARLISNETANRIALVLFFSIAYFYAIYKIIKIQLCNEQKIIHFFTLLPAIATLPLFILGLDYYRWIAIAMLNTLLLLTFIRYTTDAKPINLPKKALYILALFTLYTGPLGISIALPERLMLLKNIHALIPT